MQSHSSEPIARWLAIAYTAWMLVWIPANIQNYGWVNFLWFCNIANFLVAIGLWRRASLWLSTAAVLVLVIQALWAVDFLSALTTGSHLVGGTEYMFDDTWPLYVRALSLYHLWIPLLLLVCLGRLGYDPRAPRLATLIAWILVPVSYLAHPLRPELNLNWVDRPFGIEQVWLPDLAYLALVMLVLPAVLYWPTHWLLRRLFAPAPVGATASPAPGASDRSR